MDAFVVLFKIHNEFCYNLCNRTTSLLAISGGCNTTAKNNRKSPQPLSLTYCDPSNSQLHIPFHTEGTINCQFTRTVAINWSGTKNSQKKEKENPSLASAVWARLARESFKHSTHDLHSTIKFPLSVSAKASHFL